jgi:hypothetical protein
LEKTSSLSLDQGPQDPDETKAEAGGLGSAESFIHQQQVGSEFDGQRDRLRLAAIELVLEGRRHIGMTDVSADDPVETLDFHRARPPETLHYDFAMDSLRDDYGVVQLVQQLESSDGSEADEG